jgi:hypothetical protein
MIFNQSTIQKTDDIGKLITHYNNTITQLQQILKSIAIDNMNSEVIDFQLQHNISTLISNKAKTASIILNDNFITAIKIVRENNGLFVTLKTEDTKSVNVKLLVNYY